MDVFPGLTVLGKFESSRRDLISTSLVLRNFLAPQVCFSPDTELFRSPSGLGRGIVTEDAPKNCRPRRARPAHPEPTAGGVASSAHHAHFLAISRELRPFGEGFSIIRNSKERKKSPATRT